MVVQTQLELRDADGMDQRFAAAWQGRSHNMDSGFHQNDDTRPLSDSHSPRLAAARLPQPFARDGVEVVSAARAGRSILSALAYRLGCLLRTSWALPEASTFETLLIQINTRHAQEH